MPIKMQCPNCSQPLTVADHLAGKRINCPKCKNQAVVPDAGQPAAAAGPAPVPAPAPAQPAEEDDLALNIPGQEHTRHDETGEHKRCPGCGRDLPASTVLCTGCGHDFRTGQRRKGFEMKDPDKARRVMGSIVRNGVVALLLLVGIGGIYYAYKKGLFSPGALEDPVKKEEEKKEAPRVKPKKKEKPVEIKDTMLVVVNNRFASVSVFADREKVGEVGYRKTGKIVLPPPPKDQSTQISFEVQLPPGQQLAGNIKAALLEGLPFSGTNKQGLRVTISGPGEDMVPAEDEALPDVLDLEVIKDAATGQGLISTLKYKDCALKPVAPQKKLFLKYGEQDKRTVMKWVVQECVVERSGKTAFEPSPALFESFGVPLVVKDGKLEIEE